MHGYARVGAAAPKLLVADPAYNAQEINKILDLAQQQGIKILTFPELCLTGYTCGDLFFQSTLYNAAQQALERILAHSRSMDMLIVVGMPVRADNQIFNCAVVLHQGKIVAGVPKTFLPNHNEFYEERWFSSAQDLESGCAQLCGRGVPMGNGLLFACPDLPELVVGIEICEDLWCPIPPSSFQALNGANVILNLSASNELASKSKYRNNLVGGQSSRLIAAYVYASAGMHESTTDLVFGGHSMICENGSLLAESAQFQLESQLIWADVDIQLLMNYRRSTNSFMSHLKSQSPWEYKTITVPLKLENNLPVRRQIPPQPFVPADSQALSLHCREIFNIQRTGLARRLLHTGSKKLIIAVSGGLDSTLALLCAARACDFLGRPRSDIIGVTMPGFGTTGRTHANALELMRSLGAEVREIDIREACTTHLRDIGHDPVRRDVTYENAQARERTQVVMDIANMENGLVVGTGDLSELALGFTTYNGDHMSMYNVNCSVPKTLVRALVKWVAESGELDEASWRILLDVLDTPVSPELLPPDEDDGIQQRTEDLIGPYELHDFFLYHTIRNGFSPGKIFFLCGLAFGDKYAKEETLHWMRMFFRRFFQQQFKRSCVPDGPKVGSVALSPRGDWRMPSDASAQAWMAEIDALA